jgi:GAF domain-containing protein
VVFHAAHDALSSVIPAHVFQSGAPLRVAEVNFASDYLLKGEDLLNYRNATHGRLPDSCLVLPLRLGEEVKGVLLLENFDQGGAFSPED